MLKFLHCMNIYIKTFLILYFCRWYVIKNIINEAIDSWGRSPKALVHSNNISQFSTITLFQPPLLVLSELTWPVSCIWYSLFFSYCFDSNVHLDMQERCNFFFPFFSNNMYCSILLLRGMHPIKLIVYVVHLFWRYKFIIINGIFRT